MHDFRWVVLGDFNEILYSNEAREGRQRFQWQMRNFREAVEDCGLSDLGFTSFLFTFSNHRLGEAEYLARLDRVFAYADWKRVHPRASVSHVQLHASDHQLIVLDIDPRSGGRRARLFRYEAMWFDHPDYAKMMEDFWGNHGVDDRGWTEKLESCKELLKSWNLSAFAEVKERECRISDELDWWLIREETLWLQRSRVLWLNQGHRNTKFFHARATQRRKKNWIEKLQDHRGIVQEDQNKVMGIVSDYFRSIF
ncbi:unnamed protein product [Rhodiola kirilowii]